MLWSNLSWKNLLWMIFKWLNCRFYILNKVIKYVHCLPSHKYRLFTKKSTFENRIYKVKTSFRAVGMRATLLLQDQPPAGIRSRSTRANGLRHILAPTIQSNRGVTLEASNIFSSSTKRKKWWQCHSSANSPSCWRCLLPFWTRSTGCWNNFQT